MRNADFGVRNKTKQCESFPSAAIGNPVFMEQADRVGVKHGNMVALVHITPYPR